MKISLFSKNDSTVQEREIPFNKYYFNKSKSFLFSMGLAMLYCLSYGVVLVQEFGRLGVIETIFHAK